VYRTKCGLCQTGDLNQFLDLGTTPLADRFPATRNETEENFSLRVGCAAAANWSSYMTSCPMTSFTAATTRSTRVPQRPTARTGTRMRVRWRSSSQQAAGDRLQRRLTAEPVSKDLYTVGIDPPQGRCST
jgi:hypothetical protein